MLFFFRFIFISLLLIFTSLIFPNFKTGGKYQILFISTIATLLLRSIRMVIHNQFDLRKQGVICGSGILVGLLTARILFIGVKLTFPGILLTYLGACLLEMLLPDQRERVLIKKS